MNISLEELRAPYTFSRALKHGHARHILTRNKKIDKFRAHNPIMDLRTFIAKTPTNSGFHDSAF